MNFSLYTKNLNFLLWYLLYMVRCYLRLFLYRYAFETLKLPNNMSEDVIQWLRTHTALERTQNPYQVTANHL